MAQTRYGDLRDTFHVSRSMNNGLLRQADLSSILLVAYVGRVDDTKIVGRTHVVMSGNRR